MKQNHAIVCFCYPNKMRVGLDMLRLTFTDKKRKEDLLAREEGDKNYKRVRKDTDNFYICIA